MTQIKINQCWTIKHTTLSIKLSVDCNSVCVCVSERERERERERESQIQNTGVKLSQNVDIYDSHCIEENENENKRAGHEAGLQVSAGERRGKKTRGDTVAK